MIDEGWAFRLRCSDGIVSVGGKVFKAPPWASGENP